MDLQIASFYHGFASIKIKIKSDSELSAFIRNMTEDNSSCAYYEYVHKAAPQRTTI